MNKTTKTISYITIIAVVSKLFGFAREMVIAAYYGASWQTDAFNMANSAIGLSTAILSMGVATVIVPMYNHRLVQKGKDKADDFASNILCFTSLIYGILSAVCIVFAPVLVNFLAPDFSSEASALSLKLVRTLFLFTIVTNIVNFLTAVSQSNKKFLIPALLGLPLSTLTMLLIAVLSTHIGIYAMVIGYILGILVQAVMLMVSLRKTFKFKPMLSFTNGDIKEIAVLCIPIFLSIGVNEVNGVIDRMLASGLTEGSISAITYSLKLRGLPEGIIAAPILMVIYPMMSQYAAKKDYVNLKSLVNKAMSVLFAVMIPIALVCVYHSREIVSIVYERGAFTHEETLLTANIFIYVIPALFFAGGSGVLSNAFYGMQDTKTPRLGAVISVGSNIVLNLILVRYMQAAGLALATSVATVLNYVILLIFFRRKRGEFGGKAFVITAVKCSVAAAGMLPVFLLCTLFLSTLPVLIFFGVSVILSFAAYALLLYIMKVDIFLFALQKVKSVLKPTSTG